MEKRFIVSGMALLAAPLGAQTAHNPISAKSAHGARKAAPTAATKAAPKPAMLVKGHVTLPGGRPGAGARVYVQWLGDRGELQFQRLAVNGNGDFQATLLNSRHPQAGIPLMVTAFVPGEGFCWRLFSPDQKAALPALELKLQPMIALSGSLVRSDGMPAANTTLHIRMIFPSINLQATDLSATINPLQGDIAVHTSLLPAEDLKTYFHARADAKGRFTFAALPGSVTAEIALDNGLALAPGSAAPVNLLPNANKEVGVLSATRLGRAKIRVVDLNGKPVANVPVEVRGADPVLRSHQSSRQMRIQGMQGADSGHVPTDTQILTNAQGEAETSGLFPGDYRLLAQGRSRTFRIEEGQTGKTITLELRQGPLKGRVLDAEGKPVAHVPVALQAGINSFSVGDIATIEVLQGRRTQVVNRRGEQTAIVTDAEGRFTIPNFAWGQESVTVSAEQGDGLAEWTGPPDKIGSELSLRLKAAALVPVCGRLLDAHRQPITNVTFKALHWQNTPRIVWLMNARTAKVDAEGRFQLAGLERGESFSFITTALGDDPTGKQAFESPRFVARDAGKMQDLGDVIVHPAHEGEDDIVTQYGLESPPEILPELAGAIPTPSPTDLEDAKQALTRYRRALQTLDWEAARRNTSPASLGWSANKQAYLRNTAFSAYAGGDSESALLPLRFVPRFALTQLLSGTLPPNGTSSETSDSAMRNAAHEFGQNPNFVFLAEKHGDVLTLAGILRKEEGAWHVLNARAGSAPEDFFLLDDLQAALPTAAGFTRPAPVLDAAAQEEARQTGERYLRAWTQGRHAPMLTLTSPLSAFFTSDMAAFTRAFIKRPDGGLCPLAPETPIRLQSLEGLTLWEQEWLAQLANILAARSATGLRERRNRELSLPQFANRGDLTVLRYTASERAFAMVLARYDGKWQVVEPALPL